MAALVRSWWLEQPISARLVERTSEKIIGKQQRRHVASLLLAAVACVGKVWRLRLLGHPASVPDGTDTVTSAIRSSGC